MVCAVVLASQGTAAPAVGLPSAHSFLAATGAFTGKGQHLRNAGAGRCDGRRRSWEWELPDERRQAGCCGCSTSVPLTCVLLPAHASQQASQQASHQVSSAPMTQGACMAAARSCGLLCVRHTHLRDRRLWVAAIDQHDGQPLLLTGECMSGQCQPAPCWLASV